MERLHQAVSWSLILSKMALCCKCERVMRIDSRDQMKFNSSEKVSKTGVRLCEE